MIRSRYAFACFLLAVSTSSNATLLFSEYVEGSSYNKALELFNPDEAIDFSLVDYAIDVYVNGDTIPRYSINLSGSIGTQGTFVIGHSRADADIAGVADMLSGSLSFNGDDAITLVHNGVIVDRIGQVGVDPGSEWGTGMTSTQDNTLRRNPDILIGDVDAVLGFDPGIQWQGFAADDFSNLGHHNVEMNIVPLPENNSTSVPLPGSNVLIMVALLPLLLSRLIGRKQIVHPVAA